MMGSTTSQLAPLSSPLPIQPRPPVPVDDGNKTSSSMNSFTKPFVPASAQTTATSLADSVSIPKVFLFQSLIKKEEMFSR